MKKKKIRFFNGVDLFFEKIFVENIYTSAVVFFVLVSVCVGGALFLYKDHNAEAFVSVFFEESFDTNDYKDNVVTTGLWDTERGELRLRGDEWFGLDGTTTPESISLHMPLGVAHPFTDIKATSDGKVHIVAGYHDTLEGINKLCYYVWDGSSLTACDEVISIHSLHGEVNLEIDSLGNPHIVFKNTGEQVIYTKRILGVWTEEEVTPYTGTFTFNFEIELQSDDTPVIGFALGSISPASTAVYYRALYNGSAWILDQVGGYSSVYSGRMALDSSGAPYVVYSNRCTYQGCLINLFRWNGYDWDSFGELLDDTTEARVDQTIFGVDMAIDSFGRPHIAYQDKGGEIRTAYWNGTIWQRLSGGVGGTNSIGYEPRIEIGADDHPRIIYYYNEGLIQELRSVVWNGTIWTHGDASTLGGGSIDFGGDAVVTNFAMDGNQMIIPLFNLGEGGVYTMEIVRSANGGIVYDSENIFQSTNLTPSLSARVERISDIFIGGAYSPTSKYTLYVSAVSNPTDEDDWCEVDEVYIGTSTDFELSNCDGGKDVRGSSLRWKVKMTTTNPNLTAMISEIQFYYQYAQFSISSPAEGSTELITDPITISWDIEGTTPVDFVDIGYIRNSTDCSMATSIISGLANVGSYEWDASALSGNLGSGYRICVQDTAGVVDIGYSGSFTLSDGGPSSSVARIRFTDAMYVDKTEIDFGEIAYIELESQDLAGRGVVYVSIESSIDKENVTLQETAPDSGIFRGSFEVQEGGATIGVLNAMDGDVVSVVVYNPSNSLIDIDFLLSDEGFSTMNGTGEHNLGEGTYDAVHTQDDYFVLMKTFSSPVDFTNKKLSFDFWVNDTTIYEGRTVTVMGIPLDGLTVVLNDGSGYTVAHAIEGVSNKWTNAVVDQSDFTFQTGGIFDWSSVSGVFIAFADPEPEGSLEVRIDNVVIADFETLSDTITINASYIQFTDSSYNPITTLALGSELYMEARISTLQGNGSIVVEITSSLESESVILNEVAPGVFRGSIQTIQGGALGGVLNAEDGDVVQVTYAGAATIGSDFTDEITWSLFLPDNTLSLDAGIVTASRGSSTDGIVVRYTAPITLDFADKGLVLNVWVSDMSAFAGKQNTFGSPITLEGFSVVLMQGGSLCFASNITVTQQGAWESIFVPQGAFVDGSSAPCPLNGSSIESVFFAFATNGSDLEIKLDDVYIGNPILLNNSITVTEQITPPPTPPPSTSGGGSSSYVPYVHPKEVVYGSTFLTYVFTDLISYNAQRTFEFLIGNQERTTEVEYVEKINGNGNRQGAFTEKGLTPNTAYVGRKVRARQGVDVSYAYDFGSHYTLAEKPGKPFVAQVGERSMQLTIDPASNPDDTNYLIHETISNRYLTPNGTFVQIGGTTFYSFRMWGGRSGILIDTLIPGMSYSFRVQAQNKDGKITEWSDSAFLQMNQVKSWNEVVGEEVTPPIQPSQPQSEQGQSSSPTNQIQLVENEDIQEIAPLRLISSVVTTNKRPAFTGTAEPFSRIIVRLAGRVVGEAETDASGVWRVQSAQDFSYGNYLLEVENLTHEEKITQDFLIEPLAKSLEENIEKSEPFSQQSQRTVVPWALLAGTLVFVGYGISRKINAQKRK